MTEIDNTAALAEILGRVEHPTATVAGTVLQLHRPNRAEVAGILAVASELQDEADKDEAGGGDPSQIRLNTIDRNLGIAQRAVLACVPGIETEDGAFGLIQASGGLVGELVKTCTALCGVGGALGGLAERDPTRSSSGESSDSA